MDISTPFGVGAAADAAVASLWQRFAVASGEDEFYGAWIGLQCGQIAACGVGFVFRAEPDGLGAQLAAWPERSLPDDGLKATAAEAVRRGQGVVQGARASQGRHEFAVAFPLLVDDRPSAVVVVTLSASNEAELQAALRSLQWGTGWLETLARRRQLESEALRSERVAAALFLTTLCLQATTLEQAARDLVTELASRLRCERVSLGVLDATGCRVLAMSHSADFGRRTNLVRAIEAAMDEAVDQTVAVAHPGIDSAGWVVNRAQAILARDHGSAAVLSLPLRAGESIHGALTLEHAEGLSPEAVALARATAELVGPILHLRARAEVSGSRRLREDLRERLGRWWGPGHYVLKLTGALASTVLLLLLVVRLPYRVSADTDVEGVVRRVIGAPLDGYIATAHARAGDEVRAGQVLAELDDTDLRLKLLSWQSQQRQLELDLADARARHDRARSGVAEALIEQAKAEVSLLVMQSARTAMRAPFDAVVVSGDLSQSLGRPVRQGEVLFELAPLDSYRVILNVDEEDIEYVRAGQSGMLVLTAIPGQEFAFTVERVTPVAVAAEGRNFFRVEAKLEGGVQSLRPGMSGVGKVNTARRSLLWIWTHGMRDWLRLKLWRLIP